MRPCLTSACPSPQHCFLFWSSYPLLPPERKAQETRATPALTGSRVKCGIQQAGAESTSILHLKLNTKSRLLISCRGQRGKVSSWVQNQVSKSSSRKKCLLNLMTFTLVDPRTYCRRRELTLNSDLTIQALTQVHIYT